MPNWHTYENGLCFYRFADGSLCKRHARFDLRDKDGSGHGIFCEPHYRIRIAELRKYGILE
jgi:hypothetical protein